MIVFERVYNTGVLNLWQSAEIFGSGTRSRVYTFTNSHSQLYPISICACPSLALKRWRLNIIRIVIKRHQLAQGEASVVTAPVIRVMAKKIGEIKPLLDSWVPCNDVIS